MSKDKTGKISKTFDEISVGMDGEGFLVNSSGIAVSSEGLLGGVKGGPILCKGGGYLEDCVAWEINTEPVPLSKGRELFIQNVQSCLDSVRRKATTLDLEIDISPVKLFKKKDLVSDQASLSGCMESFDCWEMVEIDPVDLSVTNNRFASGDIHVGFPWADTEEGGIYSRISMARMLDISFGLTEVASFPKNKRIDFYGKAGIHRPTFYGVEYKTGGNFWMGNRERIGWAFDTAVWSSKYIECRLGETHNDKPMFGDFKQHVVRCRNSWNRREASSLLRNFDSMPQFPG